MSCCEACAKKEREVSVSGACLPCMTRIGAAGDDFGTDFLFVLRPGKKYWFVTTVQKWTDYKKILKLAFDGQYRILKSEEKEGYELGTHEIGSGHKVRAVWFVLEVVGTYPILTSAEFLGAPTAYLEGDAYSTGAFAQTESGHWAFNVIDAWTRPKKEAVVEWADNIAENVDEFGEKAAEAAQKIKDTLRSGTINLALVVLAIGAGAYLLSKSLDR